MNERKRLAEEYVCEVLGSAWCGHARGDECPLCKPRFSAIDAYLAGYSSRDAEVAELVGELELIVKHANADFEAFPECDPHPYNLGKISCEALEKWKGGPQ